MDLRWSVSCIPMMLRADDRDIDNSCLFGGIPGDYINIYLDLSFFMFFRVFLFAGCPLAVQVSHERVDSCQR